MPSPRTWRLVRSREHKVAGVCGGISAASGVDVTLVRLAFVAAAIGGFGFIVYLVLAFVVPKEDVARGDLLMAAPPQTARWLRIALGAGALFGLLGAFDNGPFFFNHHDDGFGFALGLALLAIGAFLLWNRRSGGTLPPWSGPSVTPTPASPVAPTPGTYPPPVVPTPTSPEATGSATGPVGTTDPADVTDPTATGTTTGATASWSARFPEPTGGAIVTPAEADAGPTTDQVPLTGTGVVVDPTTAVPYVPAPAPPMPGAAGSPTTRRTSGGVIVARVFAWLFAIAALPAAVGVGALVKAQALSLPLPGLFLGLGIAAFLYLVVWAASGRHIGGIISAIAVVLATFAAVAAFGTWRGDVGERAETPTTRAEVATGYRMAIGHQVIDLSGLAVTGDPLTVKVDQGVGLLEVVVPDGSTVAVRADVSAGVLQLFDQQFDGMTVSKQLSDGAGARSRYELDLSMGYGRIEVCRATDALTTNGHLQCTGAGS